MRALHAVLLVSLLISSAAPVEAQRTTYMPLDRDGITGLEMSIEGVTSAAPGERVVMLMTLHEVVGQSDLRPAPEARLTVVASFQRDRPLAVVETDRHGRAQVHFEVPSDLERDVEILVEAISSSQIRRRFQLPLQLSESRHLELFSTREHVSCGDAIQIWGQVRSAADRAPLPGEEVFFSVRDDAGRSLIRRRSTTTGPAGAFSFTVDAPDHEDYLSITSWLGDHEVSAEVSVEIRESPLPELFVRAVPTSRVVAPGETVAVEVMVRTPEGRPVEDAVVRGLRPPPSEHEDDDDDEVIRTDATGRARLPWQPLVESGSGDPSDITGRVVAVRPGLGRGVAEVALRVAREPYYVVVTAEGGGLIPGLSGRVFLRVVDVEGRPAAEGTPVALSSGRLGEGRALVGSDGIAVLDVEVSPEGALEESERCGGATSSRADVVIGENDRRARHETCIPLDPDGTVRVRVEPAIVVPGGEITVSLARVARASEMPVALTLLEHRAGRLTPLHQQILESGTSEVSMMLPADASGELLVRARPLWGTGQREVRGGTSLIWIAPRHNFTATASQSEPDSALLRLAAPRVDAGRRRAILALFPANEGEANTARFDSFVSSIRGGPPRAGSAVATALWLAERTPQDLSAPAVSRGREVVDTPAPSEPTLHGVLRDPWRARARYVRGRLALVIRAIEEHIANALPERRDDVATRRGRRWELNREILEAVAESPALGGEGARGLGGTPLSIDDIESLDREFNYDNIARRITRERLLRTNVALLGFMRRRGLDLSWTAPREPSLLLPQIIGARAGSDPRTLDRRELFDGWGTPFALRRTTRGGPRFSSVVPVPGHELVSAGPDGRFGTTDDMADPTARVLSAGGVYAEAVGEEELLARLRGVELSRATVMGLARVFDLRARSLCTRSREADRRRAELPAPLTPTWDLDAMERAWVPTSVLTSGSRVFDFDGHEANLPLATGAEPRRYRAVALFWSEEGGVAIAPFDVQGGVPLLLEAQLPERMGSGEELSLPLSVTVLDDETREVEIAVSFDGALSAGLGRSGAERQILRIGGGRFATTTLTLNTSEAGAATVRIVATLRGGGVSRVLEGDLRIDDAGILRNQVASTLLIDGEARLRIEVPADATDGRAELMIMAPSALMQSPEALELSREEPALAAWAYAVSGRDVPARLLDAMASEIDDAGMIEGRVPPISTACGIVVQSAAEEDLLGSEGLRDWVQTSMPDDPSSGESAESRGDELRLGSALLVALASGASPSGLDYEDAIPGIVDELRSALRMAFRTHRGDAGMMARGAAALLLLDSEDGRGLAMLQLARESLVSGLRGGLVVRGSEGSETFDGVEEVEATAALAIAARQVEDTELARGLAQGLAARSHLAEELGGATAFWFLAAGAHGVFGVGVLSEVNVHIGRESRRVSLRDGWARVPISLPRAGRDVVVLVSTPDEGGASESVLPLVRTVVRYVRPARVEEDGPLRAVIEGDPGRVGEAAALELVVTSSAEEPLARPVLLVALPSAAVMDEAGLEAIRGSSSVESVDEPDGRGVLRLELSELGPEEETHIPLPVRWIGAGEFEGFASTAFEADRPWDLSVTPGRVWTIESQAETN